MSETWKSRIVGDGEADPTELVANPANWRRHPEKQAKVLGDVLDKVGWVQSVIVNKTTGHLVDGHLRVALAIARSEESVPVSYVELDEGEEKLALASLDPLAALAVHDEAALYGLLSDVETAGEDYEALIDWLRKDEKLAPSPSQTKIDRTQEELLDRFRDAPDGTGVEVKCPECGEEFGLAGIGITS